MEVVGFVCSISPWFIDSLPFARFQYNIKKREEVQEATQEEPNPLMRKKKTPEELAAEAEAEDEDEITSTYVSPAIESMPRRQFGCQPFAR